METQVQLRAAGAVAFCVFLAGAHVPPASPETGCDPELVAAQQQVSPPEAQRAAVLGACRAAVAEDVVSDARSLAFRGVDAEARLGEEVTFTQKKDTLTMTGPGEFRYGIDYLWQPMTFTCEWDTSKNRFKKGKYKKDKAADIVALPPVKARAVSECKDEIRDQVEHEASRRGYYNPSITVEPGVIFEELSEGLQLTGRLEYELDHVQESATRLEYLCEWDVAGERLNRADLRRVGIWQAERGRITCESRDQRRETCPAPIGGRVRVYTHRSHAPCELGRSWSYTSREITVWNGCRATFEFDMR
jgi:hypothetical protein